MLDILDCFWKHYCARDFSLYLSYFLTNIGASVLVKRFFNCFHSALLNSIVYGQYILPIALVNRERCEELFLLSQCILNLWLDMDKITNVYIESAKHGVLERHSKKCDPKLVDATVKNKQNWNWLTETDFSEHSDRLSDYIVKINKPGQAYCLYCSVPKVYGSSGKRSLRKHAKRNKFHVKFEKQIQLYQCPIQNPMEKIDHMKHVLYLIVLLLIFTNKNSALL